MKDAVCMKNKAVSTLSVSMFFEFSKQVQHMQLKFRNEGSLLAVLIESTE